MTTATMTTLAALKRASRWLNSFGCNVYSQAGEDGVLAKALERLGARDFWCVEFGAWDGKYLSNTFHLVESAGYRVVLIEGDKTKFDAMSREYPFLERATVFHQYVGWTNADGLDSILSRSAIPRDFDLLSIDVDGNDAHIWKATVEYRPKLVLIEYNPTSSNRFKFIQPADPNCNQSNSPAALVDLAKTKSYELICVTPQNLLFVDAKYFNSFGIPDNSLDVMRDEDDVTSLYLGFDGSVTVDGPAKLLWHDGEPLVIAHPLPRMLRQFPPTYSRLQRVLYRARSEWKKLFR